MVLAFMLILSIIGLNAKAQQDLTLPLDPSVRYGKLDNGMTYYIKSNQEPKDRASFYMIQNVGAILEEDSQNGLAHFLEHMAFNGTKHFPGKGILNTLEKHGVAFGYNINAYTAQEETVYNLSEVPTDKPGLLDTCLLVLNDWSNYLLLTEEEIDLERGVITEEWRTRRTADFRMYRESMPYVFNNSRFSERDVIGDLDVIKNFDYDEIRNFYHDWYRTDLQAVAIVGDFDADVMEQKVKEMLGKIPAVDNPREKPEVMIADNAEPIFGLITDEEASQSSIIIYIRSLNENPGVKDVTQLRESYIESLFNRMTSQRISELLQKGEPPFITGGIYRTDLNRNYDLTAISVTAKTNEGELALSTIMEEVERIKQHGFMPGELQRAMANQLNRMENRVKEKDKISNDQFAYNYRAHFLEKQAFMDVETEFELMKVLFSTITTDDFNHRIPAWFSNENRVVLVRGPESEEVTHLSQEEALGLMTKSAQMKVEPYKDVEIATTLIAEDIMPGTIESTKSIAELDAVEWTLSNGAKVVYRFADYEKDNIGFRAISKGGSSLYENEYVPSTDMLSAMMPFYGVGDYDQPMLQKMLTGKTVDLNIQLGELSEGFRGSASPKDFETLMQLIHLRFAQPRFDEEAHKAIAGRYLAFVENMNKNPQKIMSDSLTMILTDYNPRTRVMDAEYIQDVEFEKIQKVYSERFADASDFTFFFVGNITKEELKPHVEKYIATLPSKGTREQWIDRGVNEPEGKVEKTIELELEVPKSTVYVVLNNEMEYTPENLMMFRVLGGILDLRFIESIREEEGGTYGVRSSTSLSHFPDEKGTVYIMFDTDPDKAEYLKELVYKELETIAKDGPLAKDLDKTVKNIQKERVENKEYNRYWMNTLVTLYRDGVNMNDPANYDDIVANLTTKDIKKMMKQFMKEANVVDLVFNPIASE